MIRVPPEFPRPNRHGAASSDGAAETIYVIDADEAARRALSELFEARGLRTRAFASAQAFLETVGPSARGCVVVELGQASPEGLTPIGDLRAHGSRLPVIVLTAAGNISLAVAAMRAGAIDLVEKPFDDDALVRTALRALEAQRAERSRQSAGARGDDRSARLTARESQVWELVVAGASNKAIARELGISPRTVETYRASLTTKLDVSSTAELVRLWVQRRASS